MFTDNVRQVKRTLCCIHMLRWFRKKHTLNKRWWSCWDVLMFSVWCSLRHQNVCRLLEENQREQRTIQRRATDPEVKKLLSSATEETKMFPVSCKDERAPDSSPCRATGRYSTRHIHPQHVGKLLTRFTSSAPMRQEVKVLLLTSTFIKSITVTREADSSRGLLCITSRFSSFK